MSLCPGVVVRPEGSVWGHNDFLPGPGTRSHQSFRTVPLEKGLGSPDVSGGGSTSGDPTPTTPHGV